MMVPEWIVIIIRALGAVVMLFLLTRILGKKQISQLTFFEYTTGIALGDMVGFMSTDLESNYFHGILGLMVWFLVPLIFETLSLKSKTLRLWLEGRATVFVKDGKVLEDNLKKERYTADELMEQLRQKNVFNTNEVEFAVLETSGDLSVLLKKENLPLTSKLMGLITVREEAPQMVIIDGVIQDEPLSTLGFNRGWLKNELEKSGLTVENVFIGMVDTYGQLYADLFDDKIQTPQPKARELLWSTLKKCQADLEMFALSVKDAQAKGMYSECSAGLDETVKQLEPVLKR